MRGRRPTMKTGVSGRKRTNGSNSTGCGFERRTTDAINTIPYVLHEACGAAPCDTRLKHQRRESDRQESDVQPAPSKRQLAALVIRTTTTTTRSTSSTSSTRLAVARCARARRARRLAIMRLAGGQPLHRRVLHLAIPPIGNLAFPPASLMTLRLMLGWGLGLGVGLGLEYN